MTDNEHRPPEPPQGRDPGREPDDRSRQTTLNGVPVPSSNMNDLRELKKAQTMVMVASVAGPVSLFIGGVLLSGVGLVCAIIALRKLNKLIEKRTDVSALAQRLKRSAIVGMAVCGVAFALIAISFYLMMPVVLEMMESGDYAGAVTDAGSVLQDRPRPGDKLIRCRNRIKRCRLCTEPAALCFLLPNARQPKLP